MKDILIELAFAVALSVCGVLLMHSFARINAQAAVEAFTAAAVPHQVTP